MKKVKTKNKFFYYSIFLLILSILVVFFSICLNYSFILDKEILPCNLKVNETASFDLSNSTISFGAITPMTTSSREIVITNTHTFPVSIFLYSQGNISRFLIFEKKTTIQAMENSTIPIRTIFPDKKDYGDYSGNIVMIIKREL